MSPQEFHTRFLIDQITEHLLDELANDASFPAPTVRALRQLAESDRLGNVAAVKVALQVDLAEVASEDP